MGGYVTYRPKGRSIVDRNGYQRLRNLSSPNVVFGRRTFSEGDTITDMTWNSLISILDLKSNRLIFKGQIDLINERCDFNSFSSYLICNFIMGSVHNRILNKDKLR